MHNGGGDPRTEDWRSFVIFLWPLATGEYYSQWREPYEAEDPHCDHITESGYHLDVRVVNDCLMSTELNLLCLAGVPMRQIPLGCKSLFGYPSRHFRICDIWPSIHTFPKSLLSCMPLRNWSPSPFWAHLQQGRTNYSLKSMPHLLDWPRLRLVTAKDPKLTICITYFTCTLNLELDQVATLGIVDIASSHEIWKNFIGSGIHLQELKLDLITTSSVDYLLSYSGLKKLRLTVTGLESDNRERADLFFNKCLVNHADTLEEFILIACKEGPWNFCSNNSRSIAKCTKLKFLAMNLFLETSPPHWDFCYADVVVSRSLTMFCCPITLS